MLNLKNSSSSIISELFWFCMVSFPFEKCPALDFFVVVCFFFWTEDKKWIEEYKIWQKGIKLAKKRLFEPRKNISNSIAC